MLNISSKILPINSDMKEYKLGYRKKFICYYLLFLCIFSLFMLSLMFSYNSLLLNNLPFLLKMWFANITIL